jgi:hypothetical protein
MGSKLPQYVGRQLEILEKFDKRKMETLGKNSAENKLEWKSFIREGIPDCYKRICIQKFFGFTETDA